MENVGNGAAPPDEKKDWHSIDWKQVQIFVGKAQMRIAQAEMDKDFRRVARLSRNLVRSWQAKALAVRKVTENVKVCRTPSRSGASMTTRSP